MKNIKNLVCLITVISVFCFTTSIFAGGAKETKAEKVVRGNQIDLITVKNDKGIKGEFPSQFELTEFEKLTGEKIKFTGNPLFSNESYPSIDKRLPIEPIVMAPYDSAGKYGGTLNGVSRAPESGTSGLLSVRHVNFTRMSEDLQTIIPDVAKSFKWNSDFTELILKLREGHKWSDGKPFTTEDILFWWEDIQRCTDLNENVKSQFVFGGKPMELTAIDSTTIKFAFAVPTPSFLLTSSTSYIQMFQPKHVLKQFHKNYNKDVEKLAESLGYKDWKIMFFAYYHDWKDTYHPLSGKKPIVVPTLESHVLYEETTEHRKFLANPYYHVVDTAGQQLPYINEIYEVFIGDREVVNLKITNGEIDFKSQGLELIDFSLLKKYEESGNYKVRLANTGTAYMPAPSFNLNHEDPVLRKLFNNLKFRQAMSLALNRDEINEMIYLGTGVPTQSTIGQSDKISLMTPELETYMIDYNPGKANSLLDSIGLKKNSKGFRIREDGKPLILYMTYSNQGAPSRVWELVKEYWEAVGVKVKLKEVNTDLYLSLIASNRHDVSSWNPPAASPPRFLNATYSTFTPPFGQQAKTGIKWEKWFLTNGKEGDEPPLDVKKLHRLYEKFQQTNFGSSDYEKLGREMAEIYTKNLYTLATVGEIKAPVIVNNRLKNVGKIYFKGGDYYYNYPIRPCQWYLID